MCISFLETHFGTKIKNVFTILTGAHKADLFRYAVMYVGGGVKTELIKDISLIFDAERTSYFVASYVYGTIFDGVIASPPGVPLFYDMVLSVNEWIDNTYNVSTAHIRNYEFKLRLKYKKQRNPVVSLHYFRDQYALYSHIGSAVGLVHPTRNSRLEAENATYIWVFEEQCRRRRVCMLGWLRSISRLLHGSRPQQ